MNLRVIGCNFRTAAVELREKLAFDSAKRERALLELSARYGCECVLLSTCNRVELYGVAGGPGPLASLRAALAETTGCAPADLEGVLQLRQNHEAVAHLFAVSAGLDSQIVGETEILGQVKAAYDGALARQWTGPVLNRVFQKAFQAAKHVRTHTRIGEGQISVASVAVDLAGKIYGDLAPVNVLVVGAGDIGLKTVQAFQSRGARSITVASRTLAKAEEAAVAAGGWAASLAELPEVLATADIVASSTSAPGFVLTHDLVATAMKRRAARPLFLIDLALPRDIDPATAALSNVFLYNLDDLAKIAEGNLAQREAEVSRCQAILAERTAALWPQLAERLNAPATG